LATSSPSVLFTSFNIFFLSRIDVIF
jgi:hypothetical protein